MEENPARLTIRRNLSLPKYYDRWLLDRMAERGITRGAVIRRLIDDRESRGSAHLTTATRASLMGHLNAILLLSRTLRPALRDPQLQRTASDIDAAAAAIARLLQGGSVE